MSHHRTIEALRNLAERPGTPAEGELARDMLRRLEEKEPSEESLMAHFERYLRTGSMDDLAQAIRDRRCACGAKIHPFESCDKLAEHQRIREEIGRRFPKGTRVYYNYWAYRPNESGVSTGHLPNDPRCWNWLRIKFDSLKQARNVPVYSAKGWHLSTEPMGAKDAERLARP